MLFYQKQKTKTKTKNTRIFLPMHNERKLHPVILQLITYLCILTNSKGKI